MSGLAVVPWAFWLQVDSGAKKHLFIPYKNFNGRTDEWSLQSLCGRLTLWSIPSQRMAQRGSRCRLCEATYSRQEWLT